MGSHRYSAGFMFFGLATSDDKSFLDYPCPHNDVTYQGEFNDGNEFGGIFTFGVETFHQFFVVGGLGITNQSKIELETSNVTGWTYECESDDEMYFTSIILLRYIKDRGLVIEAGYGKRRGIVLGVGLHF